MPIRRIFFIAFCITCSAFGAFERVVYSFPQEPIDVVIPCHEKDAEGLPAAIESAKKHVQGLRRIIVISSKKMTDEAEWADEALFPFSKQSIALEIFQNESMAQLHLQKTNSRIGWIYQQFLKLFAAYYIPNISSNILVLDADVVFFKPIRFIQENGAGLYAVGTEYHAPYFEHARRLLPDLHRVFEKHSGIAHHMLFQRQVLDDLFQLIFQEHRLDPWKAIAHSIPVDERGEIQASAMSEYEIYFNFVFSRSNQVRIRPLKWRDLNTKDKIEKYRKKGYDYVAVHVRN